MCPKLCKADASMRSKRQLQQAPMQRTVISLAPSTVSTRIRRRAFTDFGIENLIEFIKMHKDNPTLLKHYQPE